MSVFASTESSEGRHLANDQKKEQLTAIRGMEFPLIFKELWSDGRWKQPREGALERLVPWLQGPILFLETVSSLECENSAELATNEFFSWMLREYSSQHTEEIRPLPWLDVEQSLLFGVNLIHGDDLGLALDFRTSPEDPRVVATYWEDETQDCPYNTTPEGMSDLKPHHRAKWRVVMDSFNEFIHHLELM